MKIPACAWSETAGQEPELALGLKEGDFPRSRPQLPRILAHPRDPSISPAFPTYELLLGEWSTCTQPKGKLEALTFAPMTAISAVGQA